MLTISPIFKRGYTRAVDLVLPPLCLKCDAMVDEAGALCASCWREIHFLAPPRCRTCGIPLAGTSDFDADCGACIAEPPLYARARAVIAYDDGSRALVTRFKYNDHTELAAAFAKWMAREGGALIADCDVIAPVPLHYLRLLARRFNQAALLAQTLSRRSGRPLIADLIVRRRFTRPQIGLSPGARRRNVAHAFRLRSRYRPRIKDARVLLVDDVLTTGATVEACANVLLRAGAAKVDVLTLARVVSARHVDIAAA